MNVSQGKMHTAKMPSSPLGEPITKGSLVSASFSMQQNDHMPLWLQYANTRENISKGRFSICCPTSQPPKSKKEKQYTENFKGAPQDSGFQKVS